MYQFPRDYTYRLTTEAAWIHSAASSLTLAASTVDSGIFSIIVPPVQRQANDIVNGESVKGIFSMSRRNLLPKNFGYNKGSISRNGRGPSEHRASLFLAENVRNASER